MKPTHFDCIVIGGGHAGAEAAHASARMGARTALMTMRRDTIARMSCNPAIGGLAKGQMVREIDALGGLMGRAIDATGIQFRILNRSKGPAVQSPRAQADKYRYATWVRAALEETENLTIVETMIDRILSHEHRITGVLTEDGVTFHAPIVIVTAGTFLRGLMHTGVEQSKGGRLNERSSNKLSASLTDLGLTLGRLKTGTPPRLDAATVNLDLLEIQHGDAEPQPFSFMNDRIDQQQIPCWITYTNPHIHQLLRDNLDLAPLYTGQIRSAGPRYCPSIESKILRFADKDRHQIYLEPEDEAVTTIYCNGISTSFPKEIQVRMLKLMAGTENARIVHYAYAVEYDYVPPLQLNHNLETKAVAGLFLAGQINGTSGYEEAGVQGLLAGINAACKLRGQDPLILGRDEAYTGVLIDDLLTKEINEPYRMFTSRAEYRLTLRSDNADRRLTPRGHDLGLVTGERWQRFQHKLAAIDRVKTYLQQTRRDGHSLWDLLRRPHSPLVRDLRHDPAIAALDVPRDALDAVIIDAKYQGYLGKQERLVANLKNLEHKHVPPDLDYQNVDHLRAEAREKLGRFRPETLAQAARIGGITPADITVIQVYLKKRHSGSRP